MLLFPPPVLLLRRKKIQKVAALRVKIVLLLSRPLRLTMKLTRPLVPSMKRLKLMMLGRISQDLRDHGMNPALKRRLCHLQLIPRKSQDLRNHGTDRKTPMQKVVTSRWSVPVKNAI